MKRYVALFLALSLTFCTGCALLPSETTNNTTVDTSDQAETTQFTTEGSSAEPVVLDGDLTAISVPVTTESVIAEDGTEIFRFSYQNISLTMSGQAAADQVIVDFLNRIDTQRSTAESILSSAKANYSSSENWVPYSCQIIYNPQRLDRGILSLFGDVVTYSGASHPERTCVAVNYDLLSGDVLTLGSILTGVDAVDNLCQLVIAQLDEVADEKNLRSGYEDDVKYRFAGEESYDEDWYFTANGLCFYFSPYEIAPYSSGVIVAEIPYSKLAGIIADEFFPAEQHNLTGTATVVPFDVELASKFSQISELILDAEGQTMLISADASIQDVRVIITNPETLESYTAFAAQYLNPTDAITVQASEDVLPNIQLQYYSGNETVTVSLTN